MTTEGKILVIRGGALGDFILTLPVLAALRLGFAGRRLEILGYPTVASLAVEAGLADKVSSIESARFTGLFASDGLVAPEVAAWFAEFEFIISYLYDPQGIFRSKVGRCSSAQFIVGPHRPDETLGVHASELLLRPLRALGIDKPDPFPRFTLPAVQAKTGFLALHPGSGSERKNWPEAKWAELLKILARETDCDVLLIGGEAEGGRCARLATALPADRVQIAQDLPLIELAKRLQGCSFFIGHDSGITHLAAALGLPGLVLWGESNLTTWRPQSDRMTILRDSAGLSTLPVAAVGRALVPNLNPTLTPNRLPK